jgi:hypothetical protein
MARGFESKAVASQQEEAQRRMDEPEREQSASLLLAKRQRLELARCDILRRLSLARAEAHREMLRRALDALEAEIAALPEAAREV